MSDLKERCRTVLLTHLKTKGYPEMSKRAILNEVPAMWNALDVSGLMPEIKAAGYNYDYFVNRALAKAQEAAFDEFVADMTEQMSRPRKKRRIK